MKNSLIKIDVNENHQQIVSARELHEFLEVKTPYHIWFPRMVEYGFVENVDFTSYEQNCSKPQGGRPSTDHAITIDMAKELSMIQRNEKGKKARRYFIEVEKQWNSPEAVMARALKMADTKLLEYQNQVVELQQQLEYKTEVIKGITEDVDILTKRNVINRVVRYKKANFRERWNELYRVFKETYHVDLKARREGYNLKQTKKKDQLSIIKYAEKFGHLDNLYKVALKLYETDIKEILEQLQKIA